MTLQPNAAARADGRRRPTLDPAEVLVRLDALRRSWVPTSADEAGRLMTPPPDQQPFEQAVARRLAELRALLQLTGSFSDAASARPELDPPDGARPDERRLAASDSDRLEHRRRSSDEPR
jgi:hypothetical protein